MARRGWPEFQLRGAGSYADFVAWFEVFHMDQLDAIEMEEALPPFTHPVWSFGDATWNAGDGAVITRAAAQQGYDKVLPEIRERVESAA